MPLHAATAATTTTTRDADDTGIVVPGPLTFVDALAMEHRMLACMAGEGEGECLRAAVWQTQRSIILPSGMSRRPGIEAAARTSESGGWPVFERFTGGDVTPQFEGVLNVSLGFVLSGKDRNIQAAYRRLTAPLISFVKNEFGIDAYTSSVDGAFCDGAYNLVVGGRKLAGTAQRWRVIKPSPPAIAVGTEAAVAPPANGDADGAQRTAVLGHAALLLGHDLDDALRATNAFFAAWGSHRRVDCAAHVTIAELAGEKASHPVDFASRLARFMSQELGALPAP